LSVCVWAIPEPEASKENQITKIEMSDLLVFFSMEISDKIERGISKSTC
jgi:hypothetical protein